MSIVYKPPGYLNTEIANKEKGIEISIACLEVHSFTSQ